MSSLWHSNFVKERAAISFSSAVSSSQALVLPVLPGDTDASGCSETQLGMELRCFPCSNLPCREILCLCGTDFAVKQTRDLSKWSWGVVCECEPLETKTYGDSPWPVSRNTCISEEKEQKEKKAKYFPLPQSLEGTEGDIWHCTAWRISFKKTAWLHR